METHGRRRMVGQTFLSALRKLPNPYPLPSAVIPTPLFYFPSSAFALTPAK